MLFDNGEYTELKPPKVSSDLLQMSDTKKYSDKGAARKKFDQDNAAVVAAGSINSLPVVSYCLNQKFLGGSVGLEEGAAFVFACEEAIRTRSSLIAFPSTGGQKCNTQFWINDDATIYHSFTGIRKRETALLSLWQ